MAGEKVTRWQRFAAWWAALGEAIAEAEYENATGRPGRIVKLEAELASEKAMKEGAVWELKQVSARLDRIMAERWRELNLAEVPGLTPAERERLALVVDGCGDLARAVAKVMRHGWDGESPYSGRTNRSALEREIGSLRAVVNLLLDAGDVQLRELQGWQRTKRGRLRNWTHHQADSMPPEEQQAVQREIEIARAER